MTNFHAAQRAFRAPRSPRRFEILRDAGYIDLVESCPANVRLVHCGRCSAEVPKGAGRGYNEFMSSGYRFSTRYLCSACAGSL